MTEKCGTFKEGEKPCLPQEKIKSETLLQAQEISKDLAKDLSEKIKNGSFFKINSQDFTSLRNLKEYMSEEIVVKGYFIVFTCEYENGYGLNLTKEFKNIMLSYDFLKSYNLKNIGDQLLKEEIQGILQNFSQKFMEEFYINSLRNNIIDLLESSYILGLNSEDKLRLDEISKLYLSVKQVPENAIVVLKQTIKEGYQKLKSTENNEERGRIFYKKSLSIIKKGIKDSSLMYPESYELLKVQYIQKNLSHQENLEARKIILKSLQEQIDKGYLDKGEGDSILIQTIDDLFSLLDGDKAYEDILLFLHKLEAKEYDYLEGIEDNNPNLYDSMSINRELRDRVESRLSEIQGLISEYSRGQAISNHTTE